MTDNPGMSTPSFVPVIGRTQDGQTVWYTGRAGAGFVSADPNEAFKGYSLERARNRALNLNRGTCLHGIYFVACTGDLAGLTADSE
jgi:hypothetical protein